MRSDNTMVMVIYVMYLRTLGVIYINREFKCDILLEINKLTHTLYPNSLILLHQI